MLLFVFDMSKESSNLYENNHNFLRDKFSIEISACRATTSRGLSHSVEILMATDLALSVPKILNTQSIMEGHVR